MIRTRVSALAAGAALIVGSTLTVASPASAADVNPYDPTFVPNAVDDIVGVGSDTTQIVMHDVAEAYNVGLSGGRIASWAADGTPASITLRTGTAEIVRPNGSGAGKKLLYAPDNNVNVDFARSSSSLSTAEVAGGLKAAAFAVDGLKMAVRAAGSNAPESLTTEQILGIYKGQITNWSEVGGQPGVIKALIPQSGSGTLSFFTSRLTAANGGVSFTPVATSTQEHSDTDIKDDPNAIAPFSSARATITSTVRLVGGYEETRAVYNVVRSSDLASATLGPVLTGIFGEDGFLCSAEGKAVIEAAGFEQLATPDRGGECGNFTTSTVSNLKTSDEGAIATTTTLTATPKGAKKVELKATVSASSSSAAGKVEFYEGSTKVGTAFPSGGVATLTLTNVAVGGHSYLARFVPTDATMFATSDSATQDVVVKTPSTIAVTGTTAPYGKAKSVKVTATINGAPATGPVSVKVGSAAAKSYTLSSGVVTVPVSASVPAGALAVTATLPGNASVDAATAKITLTVAKAKPGISAKLAKTKIKASARGKVTVKVAPSGATGKITIKSGSKVVGTGTVKNGKVTIKLKKLKKGTYRLIATYSGNSNFTSAKTAKLTLKVTK